MGQSDADECACERTLHERRACSPIRKCGCWSGVEINSVFSQTIVNTTTTMTDDEQRARNSSINECIEME